MTENTSEKLLEIRNLSVQYRTDDAIVYAVNGIDLSLNRGQTLGLVGETGAGKTTTALSIMRLLPDKIGVINSGEILFNGKDLVGLPLDKIREIRGEQISMIFQDPMTSLNPILPVGDQIAEVLRLHDHGDTDGKTDGSNAAQSSNLSIDQKVDNILRLVGLPPERKKEFPHQFSGGMKQRIVIAIALACEPMLLLADEPTTALDVTIQAQVLHMMGELKDKLNTSMILITHDLGVVSQYCDTVAIMYAGEIVESGTVEDIFDSDLPHHPYTKGLFGAIPDLTKPARRLSPVPGLMPDPTELPPGCKFHVRCPDCQDVCRCDEPEIYKNGSHTIKCHLFSKN